MVSFFIYGELKGTIKGPFFYNYVEYQLVDTSRKELYPHDKTCPYREFIVHVWYPTQQRNKLFPLIIFSHGLGGDYNGLNYTWLCENLVSYGYIVVSISHSYACKPIQFLDGNNIEYLFPVPLLHFQQGDYFSNEIITWFFDIRYTIDQFEKYNQDQKSLLYNMIDTSKIITAGHSFGGSAAVQACRQDDRVKAVINFDGPLYGANALSPFTKPALFIMGLFEHSQNIVSVPEVLLKALIWSWHLKGNVIPEINILYEKMLKDICIVTITKIIHEMFSDAAYELSSVFNALVREPVSAHNIIISYVHMFLNYYIKQENNILLERNDISGITQQIK
jgi:dienelactone hydrolase